jgi:Tol biopolymer transport system component/DNA-binding winged helix-turn-helix (wHTH) protein
MPEPTQSAPIVRFGAFEVDWRAGELRKGGVRIKLQDQPFQILKILVERPGEVVSREEIQALLWPNGTVVEFDNAINSAVRKLRDALGDEAENPRFVETLTRRGYRFIAPVSTRTRSVANAAVIPPALVAGGVTRRGLRPGFAAVLGVAVVTVGAGAWIARNGTHSNRADFRVAPLTSYPGSELEPTFSPDGTRVGFAWDGPAQDNFDIYVKLVGPGGPVRLTTDPAEDRNPAWSPDGRWIAFLREVSERESAVMLVPALGGPERELARVGIHWVDTWAVPGRYLTWSADARSVLTIDRRTAPGYRVVAVSVDTGQLRPVTDPPATAMGDGGLSVSPDGQTLAFARSTAYQPTRLFVLQLSPDVKPGSLTRLDSGDDPNSRACAVDWTADGRELVFSTCGYGIWRRRVSGSAPAVRLGIGENSRNLAVSRQGRRLVYSDGGEDDNIWRLGINENRGAPAARLISSTRNETMQQYSPDGKRIAFESDRSGAEEIWTCDQAGANAVQITSFGEGWSGTPRWSPDGRSIAFDRSDGESPWGIYVVSSQGGRPVALVKNRSNNLVPSWSRDGHSIYFTSDRTGRNEIFKIRAYGGAERRITAKGGMAAVESPDGRELYFKMSETDELWKMPLEGGQESKVLDSVHDRDFAITAHGIYFASRSGKGKRTDIRYFDFGTRRADTLGSYVGRCPGFTVSPDERWLLFTQVDVVSSDLMMVENFR